MSVSHTPEYETCRYLITPASGRERRCSFTALYGGLCHRHAMRVIQHWQYDRDEFLHEAVMDLERRTRGENPHR